MMTAFVREGGAAEVTLAKKAISFRSDHGRVEESPMPWEGVAARIRVSGNCKREEGLVVGCGWEGELARKGE